jgi:hypothetical protein
MQGQSPQEFARLFMLPGVAPSQSIIGVRPTPGR